MDGKRFDDLSRRIATRQSRRGFLALIGVATTGALTWQETGAAPKDDKPTKCYGEGSPCTNGKQCCSSTCTNRQCTAEVPACTSPADCAGADDECQTRTCTNGICGVAYTPSGTPAGEQIFGDCETNVCNGAGGIEPMIDDGDTPPDVDECTVGSCADGVPGTVPREIYAPCEANGGSICDGAGNCVGCVPGACANPFECQEILGVFRCCLPSREYSSGDCSLCCSEMCGENPLAPYDCA